jgi:putative FmdB family regulatory protein
MPIYEYRCENGHTFEVIQSMSDDPVSECEECGAPVERVFNPVAVHFKGSGFYNTDYKNKGKGGAAATKDAKDKKDKKDSTSSSSDSSSKSDSKSSGDSAPAKSSSSD